MDPECYIIGNKTLKQIWLLDNLFLEWNIFIIKSNHYNLPAARPHFYIQLLHTWNITFQKWRHNTLKTQHFLSHILLLWLLLPSFHNALQSEAYETKSGNKGLTFDLWRSYPWPSEFNFDTFNFQFWVFSIECTYWFFHRSCKFCS